MTAFSRVPDLPPALRRQYLTSLPEPQEWFLEERVRSGEAWTAPDIGYAIFQGDTLVEFHAINSAEAALHLSSLVCQRPFTKALCKSFDRVLMDAAKALGWDMIETGFLFRKRLPITPHKSATFQVHPAKPDELPEIWETGRDFYDSKDEVETIFRANGLWSAVNDGQLVGSGVLLPIDETGDVVDIGMVTRPSQRNRGIASLVVAELATQLEKQGKRPICGCGQSNHASKAALQKAGFVTEHRLVQITVSG